MRLFARAPDLYARGGRELVAESVAAAVLRCHGVVERGLDFRRVHSLVKLGVEGLSERFDGLRSRLPQHALEAADGAAQPVEQRLLRAAGLGSLYRAQQVVYDRQ